VFERVTDGACYIPTMMSRLAHAALALLFGWMAFVFLGPIVLGVARRESPTGSIGVGLATAAAGLACVAASAWCAGRFNSVRD